MSTPIARVLQVIKPIPHHLLKSTELVESVETTTPPAAFLQFQCDLADELIDEAVKHEAAVSAQSDRGLQLILLDAAREKRREAAELLLHCPEYTDCD